MPKAEAPELVIRIRRDKRPPAVAVTIGHVTTEHQEPVVVCIYPRSDAGRWSFEVLADPLFDSVLGHPFSVRADDLPNRHLPISIEALAVILSLAPEDYVHVSPAEPGDLRSRGRGRWRGGEP
jgi:hypothetical protein